MTTPDREQYLHGASETEQERLESFAVLIGRSEFLPPLEPHHQILEVGCGTGALSRDVARRVPEGRVFGVDAQEAQLQTARQLADRDGIANLELRQGRAESLPFADAELDGCFCRFVLEHLNDPLAAVREMSRVVKSGGWVCALEWENGCIVCHPSVPAVDRAWAAFYELQSRSGGDAEVARKLFTILEQAGLERVEATPRAFSITASQKEKLDVYVSGAMEIIGQVHDQLLAERLTDEATLEQASLEYEALRRSDETFLVEVNVRAVGWKA